MPADQPTSAGGRELTRGRAFAADVVAIAVFAAFGRLSHDGALDPAGVARIAAPFLIAVAVGWLVLSPPQVAALAGASTATQWYSRWRFGVCLALLTCLVGLALRRLAWGDGIAAPFVIVTLLFVVAMLTGWRLVISSNR